MNDTYTVMKAVNNNVVICKKEDGGEAVFIGKGIGFGRRQGQVFDSSSYDKVYALVNEQEREQYYRLTQQEPEETMLMIHEALTTIHEAIGRQLNERVHFALTQHLVLALQRTRDETEIQNPFLTETKWLYYDTYAVAEEVVDFIYRRTGLRLPDAEIGFITLHIQSAVRHPDRHEPDLTTRCVHYAEEKLGVTFDRQHPAFQQLVQYIRMLAETPVAHRTEEVDRQIDSLLKESHPSCYTISRNIIRMLEKAGGSKAEARSYNQLVLHLLSAAGTN
ncbi:PRD domain-containing protein [Alkalicoccus chagannorensis]|uniref:PRD domain-containing protein n=1 Tax=Alkalicoccus chagannorensis TaxID=427072 RepID=UPI0003F4CAF4|nr:PRD domain-containing protein [Alkalicoccus chagannorensis]